MNCKDCTYFDGETTGTCYRYPQAVTKHKNNYCGEFKQGEVKEIEPALLEEMVNFKKMPTIRTKRK